MSRGVRVQVQTQPSQQPQYPPPQQARQPQYQQPPPRATGPPRPSGVRKAIAVIIVMVILGAILYVVFVPKVIEREEVREAKYEIVSENQDVDDVWECIEWTGWIFTSCLEYAWVRSVSLSITIRALEIEGDYVVSIEVVSGLNLSGETDDQQYYIYENDVRTFYFSFPSFAVSQDDHQHNNLYDIETTVSAPKTVEKKQLTIFESLF